MDFYNIISKICVQKALNFFSRQKVTNDLSMENALEKCITRLNMAKNGDSGVSLSLVARDLEEFHMARTFIEVLNNIKEQEVQIPKDVMQEAIYYGLIKPIYIHDDEAGRYCGYVQYKEKVYDVYISDSTCIARYGNEPQEYNSLPISFLTTGENCGVLSLAHKLC